MSSPESSGAVAAVVNTVSDVATSATNAVVAAANTATNAATTATNTAATTASSLFNNFTNTATNIATNVANNVPFLNSLMSNNTSSSGAKANNANKPANNANKPANNANKPANNANKPANNANKPANNSGNIFENIANIQSNSGNSANSANSGFSAYALYIFIGLVLTFVILFSLFNQQIKLGYQYIESNIRRFLNMSVPPDVSAATAPLVQPTPVTAPAQAPQDITPKEASVPHPSQQSLVEKVLPASGNEVFNVSQNKFSYYDAEPLCNALGAELATYDQVKDAWSNGADWCNYGWVKGQMAVYPTQKATYDKLQMGPADQRAACGTVGINGGYFDNPEFKYGVNCYGHKPSQSAHDEAMLMSEGKAPKTPATLKIDELKAEYKDEADSLFVRPFSDDKWSTS